MFGEARGLKLPYDDRADTNFIAPLRMHSLDSDLNEVNEKISRTKRAAQFLAVFFAAGHCTTKVVKLD